MQTDIDLSVIIPTRDRPDRVMDALESLKGHPQITGKLEVLVVDDGSSVPLDHLGQDAYPFRLRTIRQENAGAAAARNAGASHSSGGFLVFMDDDVTVEPGALQALMDYLLWSPRTVAMGNIRPQPPSTPTVFSAWAAGKDSWRAGTGPAVLELPCTAGNTQLLGVSRNDFERLGGFNDPTGGWPNWDDVDFGYRAHQAGRRLVEVRDARATHWDASLLTLEATSERSYRAARSAARLFRVHPGLERHLPMFADKLPVEPDDPSSLRLRKRLRPLASSSPAAAALTASVRFVELFQPGRGILSHLYRWIIGGAIYRGFRDGRRDLEAPASANPPQK